MEGAHVDRRPLDERRSGRAARGCPASCVGTMAGVVDRRGSHIHMTVTVGSKM